MTWLTFEWIPWNICGVMSLSCLLLLLFVLKLVNHMNQELEILYVIIYSYIGNTYLAMLLPPK